MKNYWRKEDNQSKDFTNVMESDGKGGYRPTQIQSIIIGQPCILQLPNGDIVQTSAVQSWTLIGGMRINTKSRTYYAI